MSHDDKYVAEYDPKPVPDPADWLITEAEYINDKGDGKQVEYLNALNQQGYNVGLNKEAKSSGKIGHEKGSIGLLVQPSLSFRLSEAFAVNIGPYYMLQKMGNKDHMVKSRVTDKIGSYYSVLNNAVVRKQQNYGVNLGLSISF